MPSDDPASMIGDYIGAAHLKRAALDAAGR